MELKISQKYAQIGISTKNARLDTNTDNAKLELHQNHAMINITTKPVKLEIDQYDAFASTGIRNNTDFAMEIARLGYEKLLGYISKRAQDGDRLAAIQLGGSPIADIALRDSCTEHEFGYGAIPAAGPRFNVTPGEVHIEPGSSILDADKRVELTYTPGRFNAEYTPGKVDIYMRQWPSISISFTGGNVDSYI